MKLDRKDGPKMAKKYAFYGPGGDGSWRWWEVGNWPDSFDVISFEDKEARIEEYKRLGHEVFKGLPAFSKAAQERLEEIEAMPESAPRQDPNPCIDTSILNR